MQCIGYTDAITAEVLLIACLVSSVSFSYAKKVYCHIILHTLTSRTAVNQNVMCDPGSGSSSSREIRMEPAESRRAWGHVDTQTCVVGCTCRQAGVSVGYSVLSSTSTERHVRELVEDRCPASWSSFSENTKLRHNTSICILKSIDEWLCLRAS